MAIVPAPTSTVIIVGGDATVGRTLELLLGGVDCHAKFLAEPSLDDPGLLDGVQLLLIAPGLNGERREALLASAKSKPSPAGIPVLELVASTRVGRAEEGHPLLTWPCRIEELKRRINAALLAKATTSEGVTARRLSKEKGDGA